MMEQYDQVVEILKDPEQLKNLSKDQVMQLYNARDQLQDRLSQIIPVLEQSKNTKLEEVVKDIENPEVKNYIMQFKDEFDDPEEFSALVEFAK
jgi:phosphoenolpyruvate-protein kinase (PTS system EI component)